MNPVEYHVLLALSAGPLHGYAIKSAIVSDSGEAVDPLAGTLYRVIARLITAGLIKETTPAGPHESHPGLERRYYALTPPGRRALTTESERMQRAAAIAKQRLRGLKA
jgi:DNA-binding PadR family transcriptional regulator